MPKTKEELTQLKNEYESVTSKLKELTEDELKLVTGGGFSGDFSNFEHPNVVLYSVNGHALFWGSSIERLSDGKHFRCTGYENNNDGTTSWVFINDGGSFEQFVFVATKEINGNILFDYNF